LSTSCRVLTTISNHAIRQSRNDIRARHKIQLPARDRMRSSPGIYDRSIWVVVIVVPYSCNSMSCCNVLYIYIYIWWSIWPSISVHIIIYIGIYIYNIHTWTFLSTSELERNGVRAAVKIAAKGRKLCCSLIGKGGNVIKYIYYTKVRHPGVHEKRSYCVFVTVLTTRKIDRWTTMHNSNAEHCILFLINLLLQLWRLFGIWITGKLYDYFQSTRC